VDWTLFAAAFGLMLVFEGLLPFALPRRYRSFLEQLLTQSNGALRRWGLFSIGLGLMLLYFTRG